MLSGVSFDMTSILTTTDVDILFVDTSGSTITTAFDTSNYSLKLTLPGSDVVYSQLKLNVVSPRINPTTKQTVMCNVFNFTRGFTSSQVYPLQVSSLHCDSSWNVDVNPYDLFHNYDPANMHIKVVCSQDVTYAIVSTKVDVILVDVVRITYTPTTYGTYVQFRLYYKNIDDSTSPVIAQYSTNVRILPSGYNGL